MLSITIHLVSILDLRPSAVNEGYLWLKGVQLLTYTPLGGPKQFHHCTHIVNTLKFHKHSIRHLGMRTGSRTSHPRISAEDIAILMFSKCFNSLNHRLAFFSYSICSDSSFVDARGPDFVEQNLCTNGVWRQKSQRVEKCGFFSGNCALLGLTSVHISRWLHSDHVVLLYP